MNPTYSLVTLPSPAPSSSKPHQIHIITNLLTPSECSSIISDHNNLIPSHVTPTTVRDREAFDDHVLSELLWERLKLFFGSEKLEDEDGCQWEVEGLNERFRLCRYLPGGKFSPHFDGKRFASVNEQSFMTVNIYLNTVPPSHHGSTRFLSPPLSPSNVLSQVQPVLGTAAIFCDNIWHDGEELLEGDKYLLRTDVMYRRKREFDFEELYGKLSNEEKGRKMLGIAEKLEDSGCSEEAVKWYKMAGSAKIPDLGY
ncbi:hypothetical protein EG329_006405 [Mollisiaceae sp. DMI_Dod_QoI]|nr:hypothetical protein EG329_006405 [Helotiales sp. DMI_Dod_QoI]